MANSYAILSELIRSNSEVATFQKDKLSELAAKDFPFPDSERLITVLKEVNEEILIIFDELQSQFQKLEHSDDDESDDENTYEELLGDLLVYSKLLWNINLLVYFVEQSAREHVSQSTVFLISYLTKKYTHNSSFFLTPLSEHNFLYRNLGRYLKDLIGDSIPNATEILKKLPENFSILSFPEIHRDNILANILLAHEVGHFIVNVEGLESKVNTKVKIDNKLFSDYMNRIGSATVEVNKKQRTISEFFEMEKVQAQILEQLTKSIESWIRELLSDMIGFRLTGPVFVFALADELLTMLPHGLANDRYPPTSYRLRIILAEIEKQKFIDAVENPEDRKKITGLIEKIKVYLTTPSAPNHDERLDIVYQAVDAVEPIIKQIADEATIGMQYASTQFGQDVCKLIKKLEEITPPCEIKDANQQILFLF
ncbi:hypothetical protein [Nitrososphaera sp.]|uniref:hypothetical protein n=1 Tax=Nitrososphaera sp. TaxID=1971748 RepID=UPI00307E23DF